MRGLVHRQQFLARLRDEIRAAERYGRFMTLLLVSVYPSSQQLHHRLSPGYQADLLYDLGMRLHGSLRETDVISALDVHELAIMLVETEGSHAARVIARLQEETDDRMEVCWAVTTYPSDAPRDNELIDIARERLQLAHRHGAGSIADGRAIHHA